MDLSQTLDDYIKTKGRKVIKDRLGGQPESFEDHSNLSLEDIIQQAKKKTAVCKVPCGIPRRCNIRVNIPSLNEEDDVDDGDIIKSMTHVKEDVLYDLDVEGTLGVQKTSGGRGRGWRRFDPNSDVLKSLDQVVHDRGILKPPKLPPWDEDEEDLPITGRNARRMVDEEEFDGALAVQRLRSTDLQAQVDPMSSSLDEVVKARGISKKVTASDQSHQKNKRGMKREAKKTEVEEELEGMEISEEVKQHPKRLRWANNFTMTPYRAVGMLAELQKDLTIELKIGKLPEDVECKPESGKYLWRCIICSGPIKGIGDSRRKVVAREMAAKNFLSLIQHVYPDVKIVKYDLPELFFVDPPRLFDWVKKAAEDHSVVATFEISMQAVDDDVEEQPGKFRQRCENVCTYYFGEKEYVASSVESSDYARIAAACKIYEDLKGQKFPPTKYDMGGDCDLNVEYEFEESEAYQLLEGSQIRGEIDSDCPRGIGILQDAKNKGSDEVLRIITRQKLSEGFRQAEKDDYNSRRLLPVNISDIQSSESVSSSPEEKKSVGEGSLSESEMGKVSPSSDALMIDESGEKDEKVETVDRSVVGLGRGRGRGRMGIVPVIFDI